MIIVFLTFVILFSFWASSHLPNPLIRILTTPFLATSLWALITFFFDRHLDGWALIILSVLFTSTFFVQLIASLLRLRLDRRRSTPL